MDIRIFSPFDDKCWHKRTKQIKWIVIHHSYTRNTNDTRRILNSRGLSTHYEVAHDGVILNYLPHNKVAYHAGWVNGEAIGIDLTHMPGKEFPQEQLDGLVDLLVYIFNQCPNIKKTIAPDKYFQKSSLELNEFGLLRHRNVGRTVCPDNLDLESVFEKVLEKLKIDN